MANVALHELLLRTVRNTRQHRRSRREDRDLVLGVQPPGRARSSGNGSALRRRHRRSRLAQAADMLALRRAGDRLRADGSAAVRAAGGFARAGTSVRMRPGVSHRLHAAGLAQKCLISMDRDFMPTTGSHVKFDGQTWPTAPARLPQMVAPDNLDRPHGQKVLALRGKSGLPRGSGCVRGSGFPYPARPRVSRSSRRRRAAHAVDIGLAAQDVQPAIERGTEQGHHVFDEFCRRHVALPGVVVG
jgi:hypothetical protein